MKEQGPSSWSTKEADSSCAGRGPGAHPVGEGFYGEGARGVERSQETAALTGAWAPGCAGWPGIRAQERKVASGSGPGAQCTGVHSRQGLGGPGVGAGVFLFALAFATQSRVQMLLQWKAGGWGGGKKDGVTHHSTGYRAMREGWHVGSPPGQFCGLEVTFSQMLPPLLLHLSKRQLCPPPPPAQLLIKKPENHPPSLPCPTLHPERSPFKVHLESAGFLCCHHSPSCHCLCPHAK